MLWWQAELVEWYRRTCLAAGAGMAASAWHQASGAASRREVFAPPRAAALPPEVVEQWRRNVRFREAFRTVGRQTVVAAGVAALYFGAEAGVRVARAGRGAAAAREQRDGAGPAREQRDGAGATATATTTIALLPQVVGRTDGLSSGVAGMLSGAALGRIRESVCCCKKGGGGGRRLPPTAPPSLSHLRLSTRPPLQKTKKKKKKNAVPTPSPGRTTLSGALVGGVLGYASGWAQASLAASVGSGGGGGAAS
jgi:hypothetical protein